MGGRQGSTRSGAGRDANRDDTRAKAERLMRDTGIPRAMAFQVASGQLNLNDVLQRLATRDKVDALMRQHDLPRSLAMQIALGQANLDDVLARRRLKALLAEHGQDSILVQAGANQRAIMLALHGGELLKGVVTQVDRFEIDLTPATGESVRVHKVHIRYAAWADHYAKVRSKRRHNAEFGGAAEPVYRPQDRYGLSDRRLFRYLEEGTRLAATVLEGDLFSGTVHWMSRWEFGLELGRGVEVVLFRHGLADVREA